MQKRQRDEKQRLDQAMVVNSLKYAEELRRNVSKQAAASNDAENAKSENSEKEK